MVIATASAISNLMKADQANSTLSEKTNMYMTILDSMNDGLIMLNAKGIVQYINPFGAKTLHIDRRKATNKPIDSLVDFDPIIMHDRGGYFRYNPYRLNFHIHRHRWLLPQYTSV